MLIRPWQRELGRCLRRGVASPRRPRRREVAYPDRGRSIGLHPALLTLMVGLLIAAMLIYTLETRLRPIVKEVAQIEAQNTVTALLEQEIMSQLSEQQISYGDFVTIERDSSGNISALTTNMPGLNLLRAKLISQVLEVLDKIDVSTIQIPLGSLLDSELVWAQGPTIKARAMSVGTVSAEFDSEFTSAGVNQTLHRIWLEISAPITVLLPGGWVEVSVDTRLCVGETVIVGKVPDTFLQFGATQVG